MGSFTVQTMLGDEALVTGTDDLGNSGKCVVSTQQWTALQEKQNFDSSIETFDAAVEAFFAPLVEAAEAVKTSQAKPDPASFVVLKEGTEAVAGEPDLIVELERDSIILRLIEGGDTSRLVWVDESTLGVLAQA